MLLQDSRRDARVDAAGDIVVLEDQERSLWDHGQIAEALPLVERALRGTPGAFSIQAAIAAEHARARHKDDTDWRRILQLYERLERIEPSPIVALNRAVALAIVDGPLVALELIDELSREGALADFHLLHAARADFARRLGNLELAERSYVRALELVGNDSERRFLMRRLSEVRAELTGPNRSSPA
jgi:RNA polymerase sigma-70 factor (ECF subfamily)